MKPHIYQPVIAYPSDLNCEAILKRVVPFNKMNPEFLAKACEMPLCDIINGHEILYKGERFKKLKKELYKTYMDKKKLPICINYDLCTDILKIDPDDGAKVDNELKKFCDLEGLTHLICCQAIYLRAELVEFTLKD
jgi:hypothetical protein